jgi:hypothetical protein
VWGQAAEGKGCGERLRDAVAEMWDPRKPRRSRSPRSSWAILTVVVVVFEFSIGTFLLRFLAFEFSITRVQSLIQFRLHRCYLE